MHYQPNVEFAFSSVEHIMRDVNSGWAIRYIHANAASFFFIFVYAQFNYLIDLNNIKRGRTFINILIFFYKNIQLLISNNIIYINIILLILEVELVFFNKIRNITYEYSNNEILCVIYSLSKNKQKSIKMPNFVIFILKIMKIYLDSG
jgi:hypothetical protein